ncbi:MAG: cytochrome c biogenesis protein ResB [Pyrinomonadaceae bacterium]|nr:cytochrome c biogenesis protein ResB [Pyrinomonadaceae bacterium]MCX7639343.1 cytochrome c biogenesis protein ResB [Pyrinomonadaceae bacterium]MDW8305241.1 cytochrome c biogenesis protein ResB [Acidobacteriota bacterium]
MSPETTKTATKTAISLAKGKPLWERALDFLSSVRFGIFLLCLLVVLSFLGMVIMQKNVQGFDTYFASLTPAERWLFGTLGLFDVYHSWYYNFLLLILSLNIILASIDRFPKAWSYIVKPKLEATRAWLLKQRYKEILKTVSNDSLAEAIKAIFEENGLKAKITERGPRTYVFAEKGKWNRMGAYIVHLALLILFLGHFVSLQTGFDADVRLIPGQTTNQIQLIEFNLDLEKGLSVERYNVDLPFTITCTDIEQKLIDPKGSIDINNTIDWRTQIRIDDPEYGTTIADIQLNKPFSYRGYRFFQASAITVGNARKMTLELTSQKDGSVTEVLLERNGFTSLPDGTVIEYDSFYPDFVLSNGQPDTRSGEYNNPAVRLNVLTPEGERKIAYAFFNRLPDGIPIGAPVAGYKFRLKDFEKVPLAHVLSIKYDPYHGAFIAWYFGGFGLLASLAFVFFFSHQRFWALIEKSKDEIIIAADTNRNHVSFEEKFKKIASKIKEITKGENYVTSDFGEKRNHFDG